MRQWLSNGKHRLLRLHDLDKVLAGAMLSCVCSEVDPKMLDDLHEFRCFWTFGILVLDFALDRQKGVVAIRCLQVEREGVRGRRRVMGRHIGFFRSSLKLPFTNDRAVFTPWRRS